MKKPVYEPLFKPSNTMKLILSKLKEKSTWLGIATILTAFGVPLPPELAGAVGDLVQAAAGIALVAITPKK